MLGDSYSLLFSPPPYTAKKQKVCFLGEDFAEKAFAIEQLTSESDGKKRLCGVSEVEVMDSADLAESDLDIYLLTDRANVEAIRNIKAARDKTNPAVCIVICLEPQFVSSQTIQQLVLGIWRAGSVPDIWVSSPAVCVNQDFIALINHSIGKRLEEWLDSNVRTPLLPENQPIDDVPSKSHACSCIML
ncbi:MAG: hypothetical protein K0S08_863 [Gammaproteobacteria bacterium]|jgi:hypothetical protein|nr:hypothetical protein [Gammaproteobacteria bacterium]